MMGGAGILAGGAIHYGDWKRTGANAQSASAALKAAGARTVAVVAIGRWLNTSYSPAGTDSESWLAEHRRPG